MMRVLTHSEIRRTAFPKLRADGKKEICPYCKNQDTDVVMDQAYIAPFRELWKDRPFEVISCFCCSAVFSVGSFASDHTGAAEVHTR